MTAEDPRRVLQTKSKTSTSEFEINETSLSQVLSWLKDVIPSLKSYYKYFSEGVFSSSVDDDKPPLRAELFSAEQMEQRGIALASEHSLSRFGMRNSLLSRLDENEAVLIASCNLLSTAVKDKSRIVPAGEWLLDNFYLIEEQIRTARKHLPKGYSRELPRLALGVSCGLPRVYDIALEVISHGDGRVDIEMLNRFVTAYQTVTPLALGELWAIPIMLRLALIENLRRVAARVTTARLQVNQAQEWANLMIDTAENEPKNLILVIADMARSNPPMHSPFVAELARRLQGHGSSLALPLTWIEARLRESSLTIEQMVLAENQQQASDQVSISNSIGSLRFLGATDWRVFVEKMSIVEQILLRDLGGVYGKMDFATRDSYRQVIDQLAKRIRLSEVDVARAALVLAGINTASSCHDDIELGYSHDNHVGYYLIGEGLSHLEKMVKTRIPFSTRLARRLGRYPLALYVSSIAIFTALFSAVLIDRITGADLIAGSVTWPAFFLEPYSWSFWLLAFFSILASSQLAGALTNWFSVLLVTSKLLPRMNFENGIPVEMRTLVVIPSLLLNNENIDALLEALEVRFLGNQDAHLHFGLLTDFCDAKTETLSSDAALIAQAKRGIEALNNKYHSHDQNRFFLFHRSRRWNSTEQCWMGYERKRGKLADLNALLRGVDQGHFSLIVGNIYALTSSACLTPVKYVITLDSDTELPRDAAHQFVATMAHPLNRPRYNADRSRVVGGYGILQPRMAANLTGASRSLYSQLYGGEPGIDPYTRSVSDVYQDVFDEGSFIGKGIYEIDAFEHTLKGRLPNNRILSHDLLEGCFARSGLLSDVHLYEEHPTDYINDVNRRERWIRGDWQIASWLFPWIPAGNTTQRRNPLSLLARWKIFDNLLRSLAPFAMLMMLLLGWFLTETPWFWTLAVVSLVLTPSILIALLDACLKPNEVLFGQHLTTVIHAAGRSLAQAAFRMACLPHEAIYSLEAILRSIGRVMFTHKLLLQWNPYAERSAHSTTTLVAFYKKLLSAPLVAVFALTAFLSMQLLSHEDLQLASVVGVLPVLLMWLFSPTIAWWVSQPLVEKEPDLSRKQRDYLHRIARKTWAFFEQFVTADDNWLPPDNVQELPGRIIAHRTSPTNIGLTLLSNLSAYDFGFISAEELLQRSNNTLDSMKKLERHQGHFYNWYDTKTLQPLPPRYISTVDSGNLAGHLLTLRAGLIFLPDQKIVDVRVFEALRTTLSIVEELFAATLIDRIKGRAFSEAVFKEAAYKTAMDGVQSVLKDLHLKIDAIYTNFPANLIGVYRQLEPIARAAAELQSNFTSAVWNENDVESESLFWIRQLSQQAQNSLAAILFLAPWLVLPDAVDENQGSEFQEYIARISNGDIPSLNQLSTCVQVLTHIDEKLEASRLQHSLLTTQAYSELIQQRWMLNLACRRATERLATINTLVLEINDLANMDYAFLYDQTRRLLAIGYNLDDFRRDTSSYDLLASEARLGNFVAIAQGKLPQDSWFSLGRLRTTAGGAPVLVSWSGSMFEYLMPNLVMPNYKGTLLHQTGRAAVARQIAYGNQRNLPWGISESGYNTVDANLNYQYHAFGVPGIGLKRGLSEDIVIAPYASALALMVEPEAACENLHRLSGLGLEGQFGFYEAIDFTPSRLPRGQTSAIVRSYMVHHQGMSLLSLAYLLLNQPMQKRFESDPMFQATLLLLQERIPKSTVLHEQVSEQLQSGIIFDIDQTQVYLPIEAVTPIPEVQLLSNGRYHVMATNAGAGYSRWKDLAVTRWREDTTCDNWGSFIYLRDIETREFWSTTYQPTLKRADTYEALFCEWRAEYRRRDHEIESYSELVVSPEDDIELRRVKLTNRSNRQRIIELTSYAEVVLATQAADAMQTSFGNLFIQTEIIEDRRAILCTRRPRSLTEPVPWMFHILAAHSSEVTDISYETDCMKFLGRGRTCFAPDAMQNTGNLSNTQGSVLDPIVAIRCRVTLEAQQSVTLDFVSGATENRAASLAMVDKYQDRHLADRVFDVAYTHSGVSLRHINASEADAALYRRLGRSVIYPNAALRADASVIIQNRRGQSGLWGYAISGDLPIILLKIASSDHIELVRQMIQCHAYWRLKGLSVDLVIWNEDHLSYRQGLQDQIIGLIATGTEAQAVDRPGGIFVRSAEQISIEDRILLQSVARAIIVDTAGSLSEQLNKRFSPDKKMARLEPNKSLRFKTLPAIFNRTTPAAPLHKPPQEKELLLPNTLGGFSRDGQEYIITTNEKNMTPVPWANVLANPNFGSVITESGLAYTWSENAHEFRLTPWSDDPVGATGGEAIYLRDEESGEFWSPTPLPLSSAPAKNAISGGSSYTTRHGFGYSVFEHIEDGIHSELWVYVDLNESVKFSVLKIHNYSGKNRRLSATGYVEWVLGDLRTKTAMHVVTEIDAGSGALFARNSFNTEFPGRVVFFDVDDSARNLTADRTEFLGRNGSIANPDALTRTHLSGKVGAAFDPCGAIQVPFELGDGQSREIIFRLGAGSDLEQARALALRLRKLGTARAALQNVKNFWQTTLTAVQVETPDPALDVLANGWLLYQTLACRIWARSGYYQSGGAFGFRDQLQDSMALVHAQPQLMREHLIRSAQRQYLKGDVQHWWHPPAGRGVRTRCSDDFLWLPLVTCRYVNATGDTGVLAENLSFLDGRDLTEHEESCYDLPSRTSESASLYHHCVRAIEHGLRFGEHGLPLMGSGDWNDGMNLVGIDGKGESVWLGFFLYDVLRTFGKLAHEYGESEFAQRCNEEAEQLRQNLELYAWDGAWYRRAYFDDGCLLGSVTNSECSIDSISQSWSVLSDAASTERKKMAMDSLDKYLVRRDQGIIQLLNPPFDKSKMNPGYIKGYVPGVRENGGQYTHAAVWAAMAFAALGDSKRAWDLMSMINPLNHTQNAQDISIYKAEPYVVAADVYAIAPHTGRGGWSWYTGSAGLYYRLIVESLLGIAREGNRLTITPCVPTQWSAYKIHYRFGNTTYHIDVTRNKNTQPENPQKNTTLLDGVAQIEQSILLVDDHNEHLVNLILN